MVRRLGKKGQSMVEYVLIFTVILIVLLAAIPGFNAEVKGLFDSAKQQVKTAATVWKGRI